MRSKLDEQVALTQEVNLRKGSVSVSVTAESLPPDGGLRAWLQVVGSFFIYFNVWGFVNSFGTFEEIYSSTILKSEPPSSIAWIGSLQAFLFLGGSALTGGFFDRGHMRTLIFIGVPFVVLGVFMTSLCHSYWQFILAHGLTVGLGNACLLVPSSAIIPQYFTSHRALAMGLSLCGGNIGGIVYSTLVSNLVPKIGFPWTVRVLGFVMLVLFLPSMILMKQRVTPSKVRSLVDLSAFTEPPYVMFVVGSLVAYFGFYVPWFFANSFGKGSGYVSQSLAPYLVTLLNTGSVVGRIVLCGAADRLGAMNMVLICLIIQMALGFGWIGVTSTANAVVVVLLYGAFSGAYISLLLTVIAVDLCHDPTKLGVRMGMFSLICGLGLLVGSPIGGSLLQTHGWVGLQVFCGAMLGGGFLLSIVTKTLIRMYKRDK